MPMVRTTSAVHLARTERRSCGMPAPAVIATGRCSIELETALVLPLQRGVPVLFSQQAIADGQCFDLGSHETAECVLGRADDGLATDVEARVDDDRAAGETFERAQQRVITRIRFPV